jgi:hypothetical protein
LNNDMEMRLAELYRLSAEYSQKIDIANPVLSQSELSAALDGWWFGQMFVSAEEADDDDGAAWWFSLNRREGGAVVVQSEITFGHEEHLLLELFSSVTHEIARQGLNDIEGVDFRRQMFAEQQRLLAIINPEWAARKAEEHRNILDHIPFQDLSYAG